MASPPPPTTSNSNNNNGTEDEMKGLREQNQKLNSEIKMLKTMLAESKGNEKKLVDEMQTLSSQMEELKASMETSKSDLAISKNIEEVLKASLFLQKLILPFALYAELHEAMNALKSTLGFLEDFLKPSETNREEEAVS
ncbi:hypothetical protein ACH5RR_028801 [Cinchona calisaya]|uniref:Uncharacterized protein n=1 Tax=Cinchona calisaya TaxID=153742 RepID=A0ABD2YTF0_9GENT